MLMNVINLWNELLITGAIVYMVALCFFVLTYLATNSRHTILGAILALITGFLSQISGIAIKVGIILTFIRLILIFI